MAKEQSVVLREVGMRDGLQMEDRILTTDEKLLLLEAASASGVSRVEVTSFVHPKAIPQLQDADALLERAQKPTGQIWSALVPNLRGAERAERAALIDEWTFFLSASEQHNQKNVRRSVRESLIDAGQVQERAVSAGRATSAVIVTSFVCPYAGPTPVEDVVRIARELHAIGYGTILLGDTIGAASPSMVRTLVRTVQDALPDVTFGLHFHNTRGQAGANALAGLAEGIRIFDGSIGGIGGCPYAPGATGNVATEDLVWLFEAEGWATGMSLERTVRAALMAERLLGRRLPGSVMRTFEGDPDVH